jgi:hypothetical protein
MFFNYSKTCVLCLFWWSHQFSSYILLNCKKRKQKKNNFITYSLSSWSYIFFLYVFFLVFFACDFFLFDVRKRWMKMHQTTSWWCRVCLIWKMIHLCRKNKFFFATSLYSLTVHFFFWHIRKWKMIRHLSKEIETDILMETLIKQTHFSPNEWEKREWASKKNENNFTLLMSCCRVLLLFVCCLYIQVSETRGRSTLVGIDFNSMSWDIMRYMISLIKHFTVYRVLISKIIH